MVISNSPEFDSPIFHLPDLGEGLEDAELIEWTVRVGDHVEENDTIAKMETAKALVEVPSPRAGVIAMLHGKPGQSIKVGAPLVTFKVMARPDAGTVVGQMAEPTGEKVLAAPAVRRMAREMGVELENVVGTGVGGRITPHDVQLAATPHREETPPEPSPQSAPARVGNVRIPFRGVRRTIAEHLRFSVNHAIHYTVMDEADVTALDAMRRKLVAASNEKVSLLPFVAAAICRVLSGTMGSKFARLNSTVDDDKQEIIQHRSVHLGIATDTENGLMVPVIRDAERLGVLELGRLIAKLAQQARDRTVKPEQLSGSTFTISNFGAMGGRFGTPIINYPEAGILAIGRAREGVVVRDGMLGVGKLLPLSLSADHRVIDGGSSASALAKIVELLQSPDELLPEVER